MLKQWLNLVQWFGLGLEEEVFPNCLPVLNIKFNNYAIFWSFLVEKFCYALISGISTLYMTHKSLYGS